MQRVAIARALVNEPEVLLLDEPLGALDLKMRTDMQLELKNMHEKLGITFVYVTHDQEEALTMSDTIIVMRNGEIQQIAAPKVVYDEPANAFVADFIGESNIFSGVMIDDFKVSFCGAVFDCVDKDFKRNEPIDAVVRPEDISVVSDKRFSHQLLATVDSCVFKGDHYQITVTANGNELIIHDTEPVAAGETVGVCIKPDFIHIMHKSRVTNELITKMYDVNKVEICGEYIDCIAPFDGGTDVKVSIDFDAVEVTDDEDDGMIRGTVANSIYKGSYYQCVIKTDDYYDFFIDTKDDWLKDDRVGLKFSPEKIRVEKIDPQKEEA
jgi:spermidine/putrescine transport system ATP-binding protein